VARSFTPASAQYYQFPRTVTLGNAITFSAWANPAATPSGAVYRTLFSIRQDASDLRNIGFDYRDNSGATLEAYWTSGAGQYREWRKQITLPVNNWSHIAWQIDWNANPDEVRLWVDGRAQSGLSNVGGTNSSPDTSGSFSAWIGTLSSSAPASDRWDGSLAEIAVWNSRLSERQIWNLAKGARAPDVQLYGLEYYASLLGQPMDLRGALTETNAPAHSTHPHVVLNRRRTSAPMVWLTAAPPPANNNNLLLLGVGD
jgi:hypothetical protein